MTPSTIISESMPGIRKAAIFVMGVGDQIGADLLRQLEPEEIRQIYSEISNLGAVAPQHMVSVFREFESMAMNGRFFAKGGTACARRLIEQALGSDYAKKVMDVPVPVAAPDEKPGFDLLQDADPGQLAQSLRDEHPQIIAMVLSNLPSKAAAEVLTAFPPEVQPQIALRMASLNRISPVVFSRIAEAISSKIKSVRQVKRADGVRTLAGLLNQVDAITSDAILARVEEEDQAMAASIRDVMFVFDDLLTLSQESMTALVAKIDRKVLTTALKGTIGKMREHFKKCMSQRAAEMLEEDMEALGPVRIRDVQSAQQRVIAIVRQLQQEGLISSGGDDYVV